LAVYRMHDESNTGRHIRTAEDMRYTRAAIEIFQSYLPRDIGGSVVHRARETYAISALGSAYMMFTRLDFAAMYAQLREAFRLSCSGKVMRHFARIFMQAVVEQSIQLFRRR
jgi:hypothetical protein